MKTIMYNCIVRNFNTGKVITTWQRLRYPYHETFHEFARHTLRLVEREYFDQSVYVTYEIAPAQ
jgi:hypothetical protein